MRLTIFIEGSQVSTFEDEIIELNSSVANTDDISKISSDYTKTFTVPANEINNALFKHYYNADIDNTFDSRTKKQGAIYLDGFLFKSGKFRLEKVNIKNHEPIAYTLNFWGNLIDIKDKLKDDEISSLPLSGMNHNYTLDNVFKGLHDATDTVYFDGNREGIIYTLHSNKKQFYWSTVPSTDTEKLVNIKANGLDFRLLKPSLQVLKLIQAIEVKYGIAFSRDFFNREDFKKLYLWCNPDTSDKKNNKEVLSFTGGGVTGFQSFIADGYFNDFNDRAYTSYSLNITAIGSYTVSFGSLTDSYYTAEATGNSTHFVNFGTAGGYFKVYITSQTGVLVSGTMQEVYYRSGFANMVTNYTIANQGIGGGTFNVALNLPKIKVIDFLKGLFQMFKLVAIPLDNGTIYINNVDDFYRSGTVRNFTNYIDFDSVDVERGDIVNKLSFKYQEPTTIYNKKFKENTGVAYSDEELSLTDDLGVALDGEALDITLPFEQVIYDRLLKPDGSKTNIQYALILDEKLEAVNPKPILFFKNRTEIPAGSTFTVKDGATSYALQDLNNPSQTLGLETPTTSLNWGVENSSWNGIVIEKTLFSEYWKSYVLAIYNVKRRTFKFKAVLPTVELLGLRLNDILKIEERFYRVNDFTVNLLNGETSLNLVNSFDANFGIFDTKDKNLEFNRLAQNFSLYVSNAQGMIVTVQTGKPWVTAVVAGSYISVTIAVNTTTLDRNFYIDANNNAGQNFRIYVEQFG